VRIDVRTARANVCVALHIQHRRPNSWADRGPNCFKQSLEQWTEVMGVGGLDELKGEGFRHTYTHTHGHTDTQTHRHTDTQTHRHTDTQTHRHTDTQTHIPTFDKPR
jgi:hypothetical protein